MFEGITDRLWFGYGEEEISVGATRQDLSDLRDREVRFHNIKRVGMDGSPLLE